MKTFKTLTLFLFILFHNLLTFGQETSLTAITDKYDALLKEKNEAVAILVKKNNKIDQIEMGNPIVNANSVFNIGSTTKTMTAVLILQEVEKGNLKLSDSIGMYLPPIKNVDGSLPITSLLSHQSGLGEIIGRNVLDIYFNATYNLNLLDEVGESNPEKIGTFSYSNTNYFLLGKIIEKVTDQSYFDLLRQRIFEPLKMKNTYPYTYKTIPNLVAPYHEGKDVSQYLDHRFFTDIAYAAGSVASTLSDMEIFFTSLFETEDLLKKESLKRMLEEGSEDYGLGIQKFKKDGQMYYGHGGNNIGYAFRNQYNPITKDIYLLFSNNIRIPYRNVIRQDVNAFLTNKPINDFSAIDLDRFEKYVGAYLIKEADLVIELVKEDNKMFLVVEAQNAKSELAQKDDNSLFELRVGVSLKIIEGEDSSLLFSQNGFTTTINRIEEE